jgi:tetratricopeptide (TPR) repeat protein
MNAAPQGLYEVGRLMQANDWRGALLRIAAELKRGPGDPHLLLHRAQCLMALGERREAMAAAQALTQQMPADPVILDALGTLYSFGNDQPRALAAFDTAVAADPRNPKYRYNRASVRRFAGDLVGAEQDFDECIRHRPADYEAYKSRSDLRTQTRDRNHVAELRALLSHAIADWRGEVQLRYALAKELEDLAQYADSFAELAQGATLRRRHMRYDVATDLSAVEWIIDAFPASPPQAPSGAAAEAPIFVLGLPRGGSTLVERILGSHPALVSAGELDCFALALVQAARRVSGGARLSRQELVQHSARVDFAALGQEYLERAAAVCGSGARFIDKMPLNYLYCGLIRRALPNAKIIHVTRDPMAHCYAMYKTLFKDAYPFSYDLQDIGQYYVGYRRLMAHWQSTLPNDIHTLRYEALVADQEGETRKLLEFCGLPWQASCLQPHNNPAASTTASAAQVRRPLYDTSIAQWRHYGAQLAALRAHLEAADAIMR